MALPNKESPMDRLDAMRKSNNAGSPQSGRFGIGQEKIRSPFVMRPKNTLSPTEPKEQDIFFHGGKEASKFNIKKLFKKSLLLRKEIRYHYNKYKLKKPDLEELQKDFLTKFGKRVDKKEYIKEINKIIGEEKKQNVFSPTGHKEILKLKSEERLLKEAGGLKSLIGKHKKIIPRYDWSRWIKGDKNKGELKNQQYSINIKEERAIDEPIQQAQVFNKKVKEAPVARSNGSQLEDKANIEDKDDQENAFPFATRKYDPGKAMPSAKEQSYSKIQISGKKSKDASAKSLSKLKLSELKFQEKFKVEEILDKAREHNLLHPPLKSGVLSPDEVRKYEITELEKMFPRYFGGFEDKAKSNKMIEELSYRIRHTEKNPKNWEKVALEENKLKFLKDISGTKDSPS